MRKLFNSYEFTFAGESSLMYGLMIYDIGSHTQSDVSFGNIAKIVETRTNNRIRPIHFGVNYHSSPLQFKLVFGSMESLDRYEMEGVSFWLTGHQDYQWLSIDQPDLEGIQFRCFITQLTPLSFGWLPYAFEATVVCDCPYAYGFPFSEEYKINGTANKLFRNDSPIREYIKPTLTFTSTYGGTLRIVNRNDNNRTFELTGIPAATTVIIDNDNGIIRETVDGINLYEGFNLNFFRLVQGDNNLAISGRGTLTLSGRLLYNVAG